MKKLAIWALIAFAVWWLWPQGELRHAPGVRIAANPLQQSIAPRSLGEVRGCSITAAAAFAIEARILHTKRYYSGGNNLVPYDVAVGWGPMSDQAVLDGLEISQGNRFFFYHWKSQPPIPQQEIQNHATNMHVIAANSEVASAVKRLQRGAFVTMRGYLVNVTGPNGFYWNTSLRRDDTGNGACEVFYVEAVEARAEPG